MEDKILKVAKEAAIEAGKIISSYFGQKAKATKKGKGVGNILTKADTDAEKRILKILTSCFPDHNIVSEEKGRVDKKSNYTWIIDPLEGTISFVAGLPAFAVSIGLVKDNILLV